MRRRFTLFGFGFIIGIMLLLFFLNGKNASCDFFPNERMLKILRNKHQTYSEDVLQLMMVNKIDSSAINELLYSGDIDFSKSKVRQKPCRYYWIDGIIQEKETSIYVQNCDTIVTIQQLHFTSK